MKNRAARIQNPRAAPKIEDRTRETQKGCDPGRAGPGIINVLQIGENKNQIPRREILLPAIGITIRTLSVEQVNQRVLSKHPRAR